MVMLQTTYTCNAFYFGGDVGIIPKGNFKCFSFHVSYSSCASTISVYDRDLDNMGC